jgi:tryptophanyl-tRNA synthetase
MSRVLTGIQSTNIPHLGNVLGAMLPAIRMSEKTGNDSLFFIANLHSITTVKDAAFLRNSTNGVAAAWIALGFNTEKNILFRQSDVTEVCELAWYLNCFTPFPMLQNAHSFKDKSDRLSDVNVGLFAYPVYMM